ncbi:MAG: hypothetical protein RL376_1557, partial [Verrucomicrobiota bacterium]
MAPHLPTVAVVIPVFNEQEVIPELLRRLTEAFSQMPDINAEVVFVDDGSRDNSATLLAQASAVDPRFTLV